MKKTIFFFSLLLANLGGNSQNCGPFAFPGNSLSSSDKTAFESAYKGPAFKLSQEYPASNKVNARALPWEKFDFTKNAESYMEALLSYCLDGMEDAKWIVQDNKVNKWYHATWLDATKIGREPISGLVMGRMAGPKEIHADQTVPVKTYSISFFNDAGGYTLGQVWCDPKKPDPAKAIFPAGTVGVKLTFVPVDSSVIPLLKGKTITVDAWIDSEKGDNKNKSLKKMRLIEISVSVKTDNANAKTGWLFANWFFNGGRGGKTLADNFVPLGLAWGQDEGITQREVTDGGTVLKEQWMNTDVFKADDRTRSQVPHQGWGNRLSGLVDHRGTSCMSCHSTASYPMKGIELIPMDSLNQDSMLFWFRNLKGKSFKEGQGSLDYSLQLAAGIRNFYDSEGGNHGEIVFRGSAKDILELFVAVKKDEFEKIELKPGLSTGRRTAVFIFFVTLIAALVGLLGYNLLRKN